MDMSKEKAVSRPQPGQSRIMGLFGRKPVKEEASCEKQQVNNKVTRRNSLERAEMAADLMDLQWSTNKKTNQGNASNLSSVDKMDGKNLKTDVEQRQASSSALNDLPNSKQIDNTSEKPKPFSEEASVGVSCEKVVTTSTAAGESVLDEKCEAISLVPRESNEPCVGNGDHDGDANGITGPSSRVTSETCDANANGIVSETVSPKSQLPNSVGLVEQGSNERDIVISRIDSQKNGLQPSLHCEISCDSMNNL